MPRNTVLIIVVAFATFILVYSFAACFTAFTDSFGWKFAILGDTQDLAASRADLFFNATQWIDSQPDIIYVSHMGDLVDDRDNLTQWQLAYDAMHALDGHAGWGAVPGNHDLEGMPVNGSGTVSGLENTTNFNTFFGDCEHYDIVKNHFIFIYIRFDHIDYAETVLQAHPKLYAIIVTHSFLNGDMFDIGFMQRIAKYNNVIAILCGHATGASLVRYSSDQGRIVNIILTNYQDISITNALKVCTVHQDRIEVKTFEPMSNNYRNGSAGFTEQFSIAYGGDLNSGFLNDGNEALLVVPYVAVAGFTPGWLYLAIGASKKGSCKSHV